jgi:N-acyl-D-amino-acid deacylase
MYDLIVRGGKLVDGTGAPARVADLAVKDGIIVAVGKVAGSAKREIDANGLLVTPGWVDIHTHYDGQATWDPYLAPSCWNGVTTVVMGNCGVGFAPAKPDKHQWLIELMEGVEDIPGSALAEGIRWDWETFPEYLDALDKDKRVMDVAAQVPHGSVRAYVMGERGARNEPATSEDIAAMAKIVGEGIEAGALGFSTSRTIFHRAKDGEYVPGTTAEEAELMGIGDAMGKVGHGVFELVADMPLSDMEFTWAKALALKNNIPVSYVMFQPIEAPDSWRDVLRRTQEAQSEGADISAQMACRPTGAVIGWQSTFHPFMEYKAYQAIADLPFAERVQKLKDPQIRASIINEKPEIDPEMAMMVQNFDRMFPLVDEKGDLDYEPFPEQSIASIAKRLGKTPTEVLYDKFMENDGRGYIYLPIFNFAHHNFDAIHEWLSHPSTVLGLSDGGAHCGLICDASFPTYMLTYWVRDRSRGARLTLEAAVQKQTQSTARLYGLNDRGVLAVGMKADINVIDFENLRILAPEMIFDLPAQGRRMIQKTEGYRATIVSGVVTFENGEATGEMPGKLVRGPQNAPAKQVAAE